MKIVLNLILVLTLFFVACNQNEKEVNKKIAYRNSRINTNLKKFSDVFVEKNNVELKTEKNIYISEISILLVKDNSYIIVDKPGNQILVFESNGKLRNLIGRSGRGPGEYVAIQSIDINNKNQILVLDTRSMRVSKYEMDGEFIRSYNVSDFTSSLLADQDDGFYLYNPIDGLKPVEGNIIFHYNDRGKKDFSFCKPFFKIDTGTGNLVKDHNNNLYASQAFCYKIVKYSSEGKYLASIDFMRNYIEPLKWDNYETYPPLTKLNNCSSLIRFAVNRKYILLEIRESNKEKKIMDIYDHEGNLLMSRIIIPSYLSFEATDDNDLLYFAKEPDNKLDLTKANCRVITYTIKRLQNER